MFHFRKMYGSGIKDRWVLMSFEQIGCDRFHTNTGSPSCCSCKCSPGSERCYSLVRFSNHHSIKHDYVLSKEMPLAQILYNLRTISCTTFMQPPQATLREATLHISHRTEFTIIVRFTNGSIIFLST